MAHERDGEHGKTRPSSPWHGKGWFEKFARAFRGVGVGVGAAGRGSWRTNSFLVHLPAAVGIVVCGLISNLSSIEWCVLTFCIVAVFSAELFNTSLEFLARAIDEQDNPWIRDALDVASGAVLVVSCGAAICAVFIFL